MSKKVNFAFFFKFFAIFSSFSNYCASKLILDPFLDPPIPYKLCYFLKYLFSFNFQLVTFVLLLQRFSTFLTMDIDLSGPVLTPEQVTRLLEAITIECELKEDLISCIHRRIYECDRILTGYTRDLEVFKEAKRRENLNPSWTPEQRDKVHKGHRDLAKRINGVEAERDKAYQEMFIEYRKIRQMRRVYEAYSALMYFV